jgi:hypothetical protein
MLPKSFDPDTLRTVALVTIAVLVVVAFLVMRAIQKMVLKVIFLGILAGIGVFVWYERAELADCRPGTTCRVAGFDVQVPNPLPTTTTSSTLPPG